MCFGWTWLQRLFLVKYFFLLVAQATKMTILVTISALALASWTSKPFYMLWVTTLWISFLTYACLIRILSLKYFWLSFSLFFFIVILLVMILPRFERFPFSLELAWQKLSALVVHQINLCYMWVTCYLLDMFGCCLGAFHLFCKLPDIVCW